MGRHESEDQGRVATNPFRAIAPAPGRHLTDEDEDHPARRALWAVSLCVVMTLAAGGLGYMMNSPAAAERIVTVYTTTARPSMDVIRSTRAKISKVPVPGPTIYRTAPAATVTIYRTAPAKPRPTVTVTETERIRVPVPGPTVVVTETVFEPVDTESE